MMRPHLSRNTRPVDTMTTKVEDVPLGGTPVPTFGARGDGVADDAPTIQKALNSGASMVAIPYGRCRLGHTQRIHSGTRFPTQPQAMLFRAEGAGPDACCFPLPKVSPESAEYEIPVEGGIGDNKNAVNSRRPDQPGSYTGVSKNFVGARELTRPHLDLHNRVSYHVRRCRTCDSHIKHIRFRPTVPRPNRDNVHLGGKCEDSPFYSLDARGLPITNDDLLALNADDGNSPAQRLGKVNGPMRRIRVYGVAAKDCPTLVRLHSLRSPIEEVVIETVRGGCRVCVLNPDGATRVWCRSPAGGVDRIRHAGGVGFRVYRTEATAPDLLIDVLTHVNGFQISISSATKSETRPLQWLPRKPPLSPIPVWGPMEGLTPGAWQAMRDGSAARLLGAAREPSALPGVLPDRVVYEIRSGRRLRLPSGRFRISRFDAQTPCIQTTTLPRMP